MFRPQEISATDARKYFSQIINKVQFSSKSFVIKSYRKPVVRLVREEYIAALEQVIGKKTVSQVLQVSGNDNLFDATKIIEIKKIFQRRLSGSPPQQPQSQSKKQENKKTKSPPPQPQVATERCSDGKEPRSKDQQKPNKPQKSRRVLLLSNGKNYQ